MRTVRKIAVVAAIAMLAVACASQKQPAAKVISDAEASLAVLREQGEKYAPQALKVVEDSIASMKSSLEKGDYAAILAQGPAVTKELVALKDAADAAKAELDAAVSRAKQDWTAYSTELPQAVDSIQRRIDALGKARRLPAGLEKAGLEDAKAGLETLKSDWAEASAAFSAGEFTEAAAQASAIKDRAAEMMAKLGMPSGG